MFGMKREEMNDLEKVELEEVKASGRYFTKTFKVYESFVGKDYLVDRLYSEATDFANSFNLDIIKVSDVVDKALVVMYKKQEQSTYE